MEDILVRYLEKLTHFNEMKKEIEDGKQDFNKERILTMAELNDELLILGDQIIKLFSDIYYEKVKIKLIVEGKEIARYSDLIREYPDFENDLTKFLNSILAERRQRAKFFSKWKRTNMIKQTDAMKGFSNQLKIYNSNPDKMDKEVLHRVLEVKDEDLTELSEYVNILGEDIVRLYNLINSTYSTDDGEKKQSKETSIEEKENSRFKRSLKVVIPNPLIGTKQPSDGGKTRNTEVEGRQPE